MSSNSIVAIKILCGKLNIFFLNLRLKRKSLNCRKRKDSPYSQEFQKAYHENLAERGGKIPELTKDVIQDSNQEKEKVQDMKKHKKKGRNHKKVFELERELYFQKKRTFRFGQQ